MTYLIIIMIINSDFIILMKDYLNLSEIKMKNFTNLSFSFIMLNQNLYFILLIFIIKVLFLYLF